MNVANAVAAPQAPSRVSTAVQQLIRHSDLVESVAILALNTFVLITRVSSVVPQVIGHSAQVILSYVGVISLNSQGRYSAKSFTDLREAFYGQDAVGFTAMAAKVSDHVVTILLTCGTFIASAAQVIKKVTFATTLFNMMSPVGVAFTLVSVALDCFQYYDNSKVLQRLEDIEVRLDAPRQKKILLHSLVQNTREFRDPVQKHLKPMVLRQLDPYTLDELKKSLTSHIDDEKIDQLFKVVCENSRKRRALTEANIGLTALGYLAMGVCRAYPNTLLQSVVLWSMSSLYTSKLGYQKYAEASLRNSINGNGHH